LLRLEDRIAEHAAAGRRPHAEDLVYADALEASTALERDLRSAAALAREDTRRRTRELREQELIVLTLAGTMSLLVALVLLPVPRHPERSDTPVRGDRTHVDLPLNVRGATPPSASTSSAVHTSTDSVVPRVAPTAGQGIHARTPSADERKSALQAGGGADRQERAAVARLHAAADLCAALAKVQQSDELPALIARINRVLDAHGTIVWMSDATTRTLSPALSSGYRDEVLARMGSIGWDEPNPAAEAFRRGEARAVDASGDSPGAVVAPLLAVTGCAGVVTSELVAGSKPDATTVDLARIFAAQLANVIAPVAMPALDETPAESAVTTGTAGL
jgi:hypothetical protein